MACQIKQDQYYSPNGEKSQLYEDLKTKVGENQAKDLFVLAYTPNFIRDVQQELIYNYKNKLPQTPSTLDFVETGRGKSRTIKVSENGIDKGRIILNPYKDGFKIKSSLVNEQERGKGIGKVLYTYVARKMIEEGQNLYSDQIRTESADGIWQYLADLGVTEDQKTIYAKPLSAFNTNGEIYAENVLEYATQLNEKTEPLSFVDQNEVRVMMSEFPEIEDSEELSDKLTEAFYKDGLFAPTKESLRTLYSKYEADLVLSDVEVLGQVKQSIEKLKRTPKIYNTTVLPATYKTNEINIFGKLKTQNPYIISQDIVEQYGGIENADLSEIKDRTITQEYLDQFKRIPAIYEDGSPIIEEIIYPDAIKLVEEPKVLQAIDAILEAPELVDTTKLEKKLSNWMLNYGITIEGFTKDLLPSLKLFVENPSIENTQLFSERYRQVFDIPVKQREYVTKIENKDRDLIYMETNQTEEKLFEQNLLQTEVANIYHRIERVDFEQMKQAFQLSSNITELQAYKDYFGYNEKPVIKTQEFYPMALINSLDYLTGEFIADFNVEKLKNPNGLNDKFAITEKGIEQKYNDPLSMAEIEAYLMDESSISIALQEYSVISKQMDNLVSNNVNNLTNKFNNRLNAVNNFDKVAIPTQTITKLNSEIVIIENGIEEFVNIENELYELINKEGNKNIYVRIEKNTNLVYNQLTPSIPSENIAVNLQNFQSSPDYINVQKKWKNSDIGDRFSCQQ